MSSHKTIHHKTISGDDLLRCLRLEARTTIQLRRKHQTAYMKQYQSSIGVLLLALLVLSSCKKEKEDLDDEDCEISVVTIAGKYKLVAAKQLEGATEQDVLHDIYEDCELDDINELKADKTFIYSDAGTVCDPNGNTSGSWNISGRTLTLNSGFSNIESFNCREFVVTYRDGAGNLIKETCKNSNYAGSAQPKP